jgi:hypothetical protein
MIKLSDRVFNTPKYKELLEKAKSLIEKYHSPADERSIAKGIPMEYLRVFYDYSKVVLPLRIRYRGKSKYHSDGYCYYHRPVDYIHRMYADTFAIYERKNV